MKTETMMFVPSLPTKRQLAAIREGFGSSGFFRPGTWARELLEETAPGLKWRGQDLLAYMIRRFGWPNSGSDDYKELCAWVITTPLDGVMLYVRPYLGTGGCGELHWGLRFSAAAAKRYLHSGPRSAYRTDYDADFDAWARRWWRAIGRPRFWVGGATPDEGMTPVVKFGTQLVHGQECLWGMYPRAAKLEPQPRLKSWVVQRVKWYFEFKTAADAAARRQLLGMDEMPADDRMPDWILCGYQDRRLELDRQWRAEGPPREVYAAVSGVIYDLLWRPVGVRDLEIAGAGLVEDYPESYENPRWLESAETWEGAGWTPAAWYRGKGSRK